MQSNILSRLKAQGLSGAFLEEMTDHYCSAYEEKIRQGHSSEQAFFLINSQIQDAQLKQTQRQLFIIHHRSKIFFGMVLLLLSVFTFLSFQPDSETASEAVNEYLEEVGIDSLIFGNVVSGNPVVTSHFGMRYNALRKKKTMHKGIDLKGKIGDPIYTPAEGIVAEVGFHEKRGNYIEINHAEGYTSRYFHLSKILVSKNEALPKGFKIGEIGNTGMSLSPHLHFEILKKETQLDPKDYLRV